MEKGIKVVAVIIVGALINKYLVRRFWPLAVTTTTTGA